MKLAAASAFTLAALLSATLAAPAARADTISLPAPLAGATLHADRIDMAAYFVEASGDAFEVVVTYVDDTAPDQPRRIIMGLRDGDSARFGLPEHPGTLYTFARDGGVVTISDYTDPRSLPNG